MVAHVRLERVRSDPDGSGGRYLQVLRHAEQGGEGAEQEGKQLYLIFMDAETHGSGASGNDAPVRSKNFFAHAFGVYFLLFYDKI